MGQGATQDTGPTGASTRGAQFFRADLHIHSSHASHDVSDLGATPEAIVASAKALDLAIIALADHNDISNVGAAIKAGDQAGVLVIPGVELSTPQGHLLCYTPNLQTLQTFFHRLSVVDVGLPDSRCQTQMMDCLTKVAEVGGFGVIAHIESDGAFESKMPGAGPAKRDILSHPALEAIEITRLDCPYHYSRFDEDDARKQMGAARNAARGLGTQQVLARIMNSDAHTLNAFERNAKNDRRVTRFKMEQPSFDGLRQALRTADTRVRLEEELPRSVPMVDRVHFEGRFLSDIAIRFSPNLTCIIGGRGSGKSTIFESVCLLTGREAPESGVVDSDVWPEMLSIGYRDETGYVHELARSLDGDVENMDSPDTGAVIFPLESYRQGETNELSQRVTTDPLALLGFIDRLFDVSALVNQENEFREQLMALAPKISNETAKVAKIDGLQKELTVVQGKLQRFRDDKGEAIIALQQQLEGERRARLAIEADLSRLDDAVDTTDVSEVIASIRESLTDESIGQGSMEVKAIEDETGKFESSVGASTKALHNATKSYVAQVKLQSKSWQAKEKKTSDDIKVKQDELLRHGIRLDMAFIQKLTADENRLKDQIRRLKLSVAVLKDLKRDYASALKSRWEARQLVASHRVAFAKKTSKSLESGVADLAISLKFSESALSPDADRAICDAMGWRTSAQMKAHALINDFTLPRLLACVANNNISKILELRNEADGSIFSTDEARMLLERISDPGLLAELQAAEVLDRPRLNVSKPPVAGSKSPPKGRDFNRLSLGQQQSVLLALMLKSESRAPLVIDQPEDNLDSEFIYSTLVPAIREAKERRQVIVITHNANIAVLGDAELIVALKATNERASVMASGSIDLPAARDMACAILEGSAEAFRRRASIYGMDLV
jgi:energy-coupling factor transporter ATP-binding protein EcfA2